MGYQQGGTAPHDLREGLVDLVLDAGVDRGGGVVQEQQAGVGEDGPRERDTLALAARQGEPVLADLGVVALGQLGDEAVCLRCTRGPLDLLLGGPRVSEGDVGADRVREEEAFLGDEPDGGAQRLLGQLADVVAADQDGSVRHVVEARQQEREGGLAAAGRTDDGDGLTGLDREREAVEHRTVVLVAEADVVELHARGGVCREFLAAVPHGGLGVDQFQYALCATRAC